MRRSTLFWGGILILVGILLLLNNLGIFNVNIWSILWPLLLIAFGLWILVNSIWRPKNLTEHASVPLEGARSASLRFQHGAGRLELASGASGDTAMEGDFSGGLDLSQRRTGDELDLVLAAPVNIPFGGPEFGNNWSVRLASGVPYRLTLNTGAGESRLDLRDLQVTHLEISSGASSTDLTLPERAGFTRAKISTGAASVTVRIPQGVGAYIRTRGALSSFNVPTGVFTRVDDTYVTPGYQDAPNRVELDIETGVGSVEILMI
jgi:hypothetical protein